MNHLQIKNLTRRRFKLSLVFSVGNLGTKLLFGQVKPCQSHRVNFRLVYKL